MLFRSIRFTGTGDTIDFPNTGSYDFVITSPTLNNLNGNIGGTFNVGTINYPATGVEQASVTTSNGTFSVFDGTTYTLTAGLDWKDITIYNSLSGVMNGTGLVNLTSISYSGTNTDLVAIRDGTEQTVVLSFQFSPLKKKSLYQLMTNGQVNSTSFSGSVSADRKSVV